MSVRPIVLTLCLSLNILFSGNIYAMAFADTLTIDLSVPGAETDSAIANSNARLIADITAPAETGRLEQISDSLIRESNRIFQRQNFVPDPNRALWLSLVFPGAGQIYNRKFWKLPIFYGGFMGCAYALSWNQQMYLDYSQAYLDIMDDDPGTKSYEEMLPPRYKIEGREEQFKSIFKRKKDYYRHYRDMSAFCFFGVYLLSVIDAYVDAHLSEFDISPDLSMRIHPSVINNNDRVGKNGCSVGLGCSLCF